jgi:hypothetical protein
LTCVDPHHRADLNTLGLVANYAAITEGEEWLRQANAYVEANHELVVNFVNDKIAPMISAPRRRHHHIPMTGVPRRSTKKLAGGLQPHEGRERTSSRRSRWSSASS